MSQYGNDRIRNETEQAAPEGGLVRTGPWPLILNDTRLSLLPEESSAWGAGMKGSKLMKISTAIISSVFALSLIAGGSDAFAKAGKVDSVENEGRVIVIGGTKYKVSGSKTKVTIGGKPGKRGQIKAGMMCDAKGKGTATSIDCK
jgi:hypothetical protein